MSEFDVRYKVVATKTARKQGLKLGLSPRSLDWLISQMKRLCFWPENSGEFDYEKFCGAFEFKFNHIENKWIRIFVYQDDVRKTMWVIKVMAKKQNALSTADKISVQTAVSLMEQDIKEFERQQQKQTQLDNLKVIQGGKDEK